MRICPICETETEEKKCPKDNYETIDLERFRNAERADPIIGKVLNSRYKIISKLGQGGMGAVYLAVHTTLKQEVAVKILNTSLLSDVEAVKRFHREALAASKLTHPNTVRIFDFGEDEDGLLYIVMEYARGLPLSSILYRELRLSPERVVNITKQILGALAEAHRHGIVHRDLKPSNIIINNVPGTGEFVKVVDFGIAKIVEGSGDTAITKAGGIVGTPTYMAPEQAEGKPVDQRTDLYSLGIIMYEMLTGSPPFLGDTPISVMVSHRLDPVPPMPAEVAYKVPIEMANMIDSLLEKSPDKRPQTADEALAMLETSATGDKQTVINTKSQTSPSKKQTTKGMVVLISILTAIFLGGGMGIVLYNFDLFVFSPTQIDVESHPEEDVMESFGEKTQDTFEIRREMYKVVRIISNPPGAMVMESGRVVGKTPYVAVVNGKTRVLLIRKPGYHDKIVTVSGMEQEIDVRLLVK